MNIETKLTTLVGKFREDGNYLQIKDRFERMRYLVQSYPNEMNQLGRAVYSSCQGHRSAAQQKSASQANYQMDQVNQLYLRHQTEPLTDQEYEAMFQEGDKALKSFPIDWSNQYWMMRLAEFYLQRATLSSDRKNRSSKSLSDLQHASSILAKLPDHILESYMKHNPENMLLLKILELKKQVLPAHKVLALGTEKVLGVSGIEEVSELDRFIPEDSSKAAVSGVFENIPDMQEISGKEEICVNPSIDEVVRMIRDLELVLKKKSALTKDNPNYRFSPKVRLTYSSQEGRSMVALDHISPGEVIIEDMANSVILFNEFLFDYCGYCHREIETFWPCSRCSEVGYCSLECEELAFKEFHQWECGIYGLLVGTVENPVYSVPHVFRKYTRFGTGLVLACEQDEVLQASEFDIHYYFDSPGLRTEPCYSKLCSEDQALMCRSMTSLVHNRDLHKLERETLTSGMAVSLVYHLMFVGLVEEDLVDDEYEFARVVEHLACELTRVCTNSFCWSTERDDGLSYGSTRIGSCINLASSFLNHSCLPNVDWHISSRAQMIMTASVSISPGDPVTISYGPRDGQPYQQRKARLGEDYCFKCRCGACDRDEAKQVLEDFMSVIKRIVCSPKSAVNGQQNGVLTFAVNSSNLTELESHFKTYLSLVAFDGVDLAEKCALLLRLYHEAGINIRGLYLVRYLDRCLKAVTSSALNKLDRSKLIKALDYSAYFYRQLARKSPQRLMISFEPGYFYRFLTRLDLKLKELLEGMENLAEFSQVYETRSSQNWLKNKPDSAYLAKVYRLVCGRLGLYG